MKERFLYVLFVTQAYFQIVMYIYQAMIPRAFRLWNYENVVIRYRI